MRLVATGAQDGEFRIALDTFGDSPLLIGDDKFKGEVVEGVAEVLEAISNDEAEFGGRRRLEDFDPKELLGAINIGFFPSSVRVSFAPGVHFLFKSVQVVDRPL